MKKFLLILLLFAPACAPVHYVNEEGCTVTVYEEAGEVREEVSSCP